ncbi:MAG: spore coat U domain-containing protein [Pseudomonadota bacterium]
MSTSARFAALILACLLAAGPARAVLSCTIQSAPPVAFGNYNPLLFSDHDAQSSMNISCTGTGSELMEARLGAGVAGTVGARVMRNGGASLAYGLYTNSGRTVAWGDGTAGTSTQVVRIRPGSNITFQIYGRIPQRQNVPVGLYNDTVIIQLDW